MDNNYSLSDIAAVSGANEGFLNGGNGGMYVFALLILLMMGNNGGLFGGNRDRSATVGDIQRSQDFEAIERQMNEGVQATRQGVYDTTSAIKDGNYNILGELRDIQQATNLGFAESAKCCCDLQRNIDSVRFDMANYSAAIQANSTANTQKILDAMCTNRMSDMQNQINQLQLNQALCGVPKMSPYGYGMYPTWPQNPGGCCGQ